MAGLEPLEFINLFPMWSYRTDVANIQRKVTITIYRVTGCVSYVELCIYLELYRLVSEFGRVCERIKLQANVGKSKVEMYSRYVNVGLMDARLNV